MMNNVTKINSNLLEELGVSNSEILFQLGLLTLCKNKIGFARFFFQDAANQGNTRARKYSDILKNNARTISKWRQVIIDLEAKFIVFGEDE